MGEEQDIINKTANNNNQNKHSYVCTKLLSGETNVNVIVVQPSRCKHCSVLIQLQLQLNTVL